MDPNDTPRDREADLLDRCVLAARGEITRAQSQIEANFFSLASSTVLSTFPEVSRALERSAGAYFADHPSDELHPAEVIRNGWVISMPRLRDMLTEILERSR